MAIHTFTSTVNLRCYKYYKSLFSSYTLYFRTWSVIPHHVFSKVSVLLIVTKSFENTFKHRMEAL